MEKTVPGDYNFDFGGQRPRDAYRWISLSHNVGFSCGGTIPVPGCILVFRAGGGFLGYGHVCYVTAVNSDGSVEVTEQMCDQSWGCHRGHTYSTTTILDELAGFIYYNMAMQEGTPKAIGTSETVIDDWNGSNVYNFAA